MSTLVAAVNIVQLRYLIASSPIHTSTGGYTTHAGQNSHRETRRHSESSRRRP